MTERSPDSGTGPADLPFHSRDTLISLLREARARSGYSVRRLADAVELPPSTVHGWLTGRHLPTPQLRDQFVAVLAALDLAHGEQAEVWLSALGRISSDAFVAKPAPFVGLRPYEARDAADFVGHGDLIGQLARRVRDAGPGEPVIVVGASGSGKSSLLGAGLLGTALADGGALAGYQGVRRYVDDLTDQLPPAPAVVVIDQLEDQIARGDRAGAERVFDWVLDLPTGIVPVLAVRADAFDIVVAEPRFAAALRSPVIVGEPTIAECLEIALRPTERAGYRVEPALRDVLVEDIAQFQRTSHGILPLLSNALLATWDRCDDGILRVADYLAIGGLGGGLNAIAEDLYSGLDEARQPNVKHIFLSLLEISGEQLSRRSVPIDDVPEAMRDVVDLLVSARLLHIGDGRLMISHESLIRHWTRLREWVEDESMWLRYLRQLRAATSVWVTAERDPEMLVPVMGLAWQERLEKDAALGGVLTRDEMDFVAASVKRGRAQLDAERSTNRRLRRSSRTAWATTAIAALLAIATTIAAVWAQQASIGAEAASREAQSRQLALVATDLLETDRNLAAQFAVAGHELADTLESRSAVIRTFVEPMPTRQLGSSGTTMVAATADGSVIVTARGDGQLTIARDGGLAARETVTVGDGQLFALQVREVGGRILAAVGGQRTASLWDITTEPKRLGEFGADSVAYSAVLTRDLLAFGLLDGTVARIDISDPESPREVQAYDTGIDAPVYVLAAAGRTLVYGAGDVNIERDGNQQRIEVEAGTALSAALSPDGSQLALGTSNGTVRRFDLGGDPQEIEPLTGFGSYVNAVTYDNDHVAAASSDGSVAVFDAAGTQLARLHHPEPVTSVATAAGRVLSGALDGAVRWWPEEISPLLDDQQIVFAGPATPGWAMLLPRRELPRLFKVSEAGLQPLASLQLPDGLAPATAGAMPASAKFVVGASQSGEVLTWPLENQSAGQAVVSKLTQDQPSLLEVSASGEFLLANRTRKSDVVIARRDGLSWREVATLDGWHHVASFIDDTPTFATATEQGDVAIWRWDGSSVARIASIECDAAPSVVKYAASQQLLWVAENGGELRGFRVTDGSVSTEPEVRYRAATSIQDVSASEDGWLYAVDSESRLLVWPAGELTSDPTLSVPLGFRAIGVTAAGTGIIPTGMSPRMWPWQREPGEVRRVVCADRGEAITAAEWTRLAPGIEPFDPCRGQETN